MSAGRTGGAVWPSAIAARRDYTRCCRPTGRFQLTCVVRVSDERSTKPGQVGLFRRGVVTPAVVFPGPARLPGNRQNLNVIHLHRVGEQDLHIDASIGRQTRDQLVLVLDAGAVHPGLIQTLTDGLNLVSRKPL